VKTDIRFTISNKQLSYPEVHHKYTSLELIHTSSDHFNTFFHPRTMSSHPYCHEGFWPKFVCFSYAPS
jgi:hypothetical protein